VASQRSVDARTPVLPKPARFHQVAPRVVTGGMPVDAAFRPVGVAVRPIIGPLDQVPPLVVAIREAVIPFAVQAGLVVRPEVPSLDPIAALVVKCRPAVCILHS